MREIWLETQIECINDEFVRNNTVLIEDWTRNKFAKILRIDVPSAYYRWVLVEGKQEPLIVEPNKPVYIVETEKTLAEKKNLIENLVEDLRKLSDKLRKCSNAPYGTFGIEVKPNSSVHRISDRADSEMRRKLVEFASKCEKLSNELEEVVSELEEVLR